MRRGGVRNAAIHDICVTGVRGRHVAIPTPNVCTTPHTSYASPQPRAGTATLAHNTGARCGLSEAQLGTRTRAAAAHDFAGRRIEDIDDAAVLRLHPLATDEQALATHLRKVSVAR